MIESFEFEPYVGVGPVHFGMSRDEVRKIIDCSYRELKKEEYQDESDFFKDCWMSVSYSDDIKVEFIEISRYGQFNFHSRSPFEFTLDKAIEFFTDVAGEPIIGDSSYDFRAIGLGLGVPSMKEEPKLETIFIYRKGYWDGTPWA